VSEHPELPWISLLILSAAREGHVPLQLRQSADTPTARRPAL